MPPIGISMHGLEQKIRAIAEAMKQCGEIDFPTPRCFANTHGITTSTLATALRTGRLTSELNSKILEAAEIDASEVTWLDPEYPPRFHSRSDGANYAGRDSVARFRSFYFRKKGLVGQNFRRVKGDIPQLIDSNLAIFALDDAGQEHSPDAPISLFFNLVIEHGLDDAGIRFGFRRVRLRLLRRRGAARIKNRLGDIKLGDAKLIVRGNNFHAEWFLEAPAKALRGDYTTTMPICDLVGAEVGESFEAELSVNAIDGSLVAEDGEILPPDKVGAVISALFIDKIFGPRESHGWRVLGYQQISIVRADSR